MLQVFRIITKQALSIPIWDLKLKNIFSLSLSCYFHTFFMSLSRNGNGSKINFLYAKKKNRKTRVCVLASVKDVRDALWEKYYFVAIILMLFDVWFMSFLHSVSLA